MDDHGHAIGRGVHVALHAVYPSLEREAERRHRVLGTVLRFAPVRDDLRHVDGARPERQTDRETERETGSPKYHHLTITMIPPEMT